jgi:steroid delta-isomerase-like uncharacterized protein
VYGGFYFGLCSGSKKGENLMSEANKSIVHRVVEECVNQGNLDVADELLATDYIDHDALPGVAPGVEGFKQVISMYRAAFPDLNVTIEDTFTEGDKVVARWVGKGTHKGELMGIPPTGKEVSVTGMEINRIAEGKIVEHWENIDLLGMMVQLGVVPPPGG